MSATHRIVGPLVIERRVDMERAWHRAFENYFKPLGVEVRWLNYTVRPATNFGEQCYSLSCCTARTADSKSAVTLGTHWRRQAPAAPTLPHT